MTADPSTVEMTTVQVIPHEPQRSDAATSPDLPPLTRGSSKIMVPKTTLRDNHNQHFADWEAADNVSPIILPVEGKKKQFGHRQRVEKSLDLGSPAGGEDSRAGTGTSESSGSSPRRTSTEPRTLPDLPPGFTQFSGKPIGAKSSCRLSQVLPDPGPKVLNPLRSPTEEQAPAFRPISESHGVSARDVSVSSGQFLQDGSWNQGPRESGLQMVERPQPDQFERQMPAVAVAPEDASDGPPWKIMLFTTNLLIGLAVSQVIMANKAYKKTVAVSTMYFLAFIMIGVGYEFEIDKSRIKDYGKDMAIAMGAAAVPWLLGAAWFMIALPDPLPLAEALAVAIFSAPTSAGILFSMLEAAGLKETWLFQKARILAIFDDLGTILLLIPIKALIMGPQWELSIIMILIVLFLGCGWINLHKFVVPSVWNWTLLYAVIVTGTCELLYYVTDDHIPMESVHLEVLLPAFTFGVMIYVNHGHDESSSPHTAPGPPGGKKAGDEIDIAPPRRSSTAAGARRRSSVTMRRRSLTATEEKGCGKYEDTVATVMSAVFMILVGLSMPKLEIFGGQMGSGSGSGSEESSSMGIGMLMFHVVCMTILMILGKMVPICFYKDEASLKERFALCVGMCPRGEVGAGVIVVALQLGIKGDAITIAVMCLALNLILSGFFIMIVKKLARSEVKADEAPSTTENPNEA